MEHIDLSTLTLEELLKLEQGIKRERERRQHEERATLLDTVQANFLTVKSHALNLSLSSNFLTKEITVANPDVLTATVATGIGNRTDTIEVTRLAAFSSFQSNGFADGSAAVNTSGADQTFAYKLGATGETISLTVIDGTTLQQLAGLINDAAHNPGVTATIINDGAESNVTCLVLQAKNSGENNRITLVTPLPGLPFTELQDSGTSLNAQLKANGITYERQSNTGISDIIQGITLNPHQTGTTTIKVDNDTSTVQTDLLALIDSMNKAFQDITAKSAYDQETGK